MNSGYAIALILTTIMASIVATMAMRRIKAPGAPGLAVAMVGVMVWSMTYALRWLSADCVTAAFWLDMTYLGVVSVPTAFVFVALQVTNNSIHISRRHILVVATEPILTLIILFTDKYHGLFYAGMRRSGSILNGGIWFWINAIYSYALLAVALVALIRSLKSARDLYRSQILTLAVGMFLPWFGNIAGLGGLSPFGDLDLTPFCFLVSGAIIAFGLFRYRLLDIVPIAHELLVENLSDGIIVADSQGRVVDLNPATKKFLGIDGSMIGKPLDVIRDLCPRGAHVDLETPGQTWECVSSASPGHSFEVRVSPLKDRELHAKGWLILLRDITERKIFEMELERRSTHDILTGLYNRQYFEEAMARLEKTDHEALSIVMIDLDGLKDINDARGHAAGDEIIRETAAILVSTIGGNDILARVGGDEFIIIMPDTYTVEATARVDTIRKKIRARNAANPAVPDIGLSMGVAGRMQGESLAATLKRADDAMYAEKYRKKYFKSHLSRVEAPADPGPARER